MKYTVNNYYHITHPGKSHFVGCELEDVRYVEHDNRYVGRVSGERFNRQFTREELDIEEEQSQDMIAVTFKHWYDEDTEKEGWDIYHAGRRDSVKERRLLNLIMLNHQPEAYEVQQPYVIRRELLHGLIHKNTGMRIVADNAPCFEPSKRQQTTYASLA